MKLSQQEIKACLIAPLAVWPLIFIALFHIVPEDKGAFWVNLWFSLILTVPAYGYALLIGGLCLPLYKFLQARSWAYFPIVFALGAVVGAYALAGLVYVLPEPLFVTCFDETQSYEIPCPVPGRTYAFGGICGFCVALLFVLMKSRFLVD